MSCCISRIGIGATALVGAFAHVAGAICASNGIELALYAGGCIPAYPLVNGTAGKTIDELRGICHEAAGLQIGATALSILAPILFRTASLNLLQYIETDTSQEKRALLPKRSLLTKPWARKIWVRKISDLCGSTPVQGALVATACVSSIALPFIYFTGHFYPYDFSKIAITTLAIAQPAAFAAITAKRCYDESMKPQPPQEAQKLTLPITEIELPKVEV